MAATVKWDKKTFAELFGGRHDGLIVAPPIAMMTHYKVPVVLSFEDKQQTRVGHAIYQFEKIERLPDGKQRARYNYIREDYFECWQNAG